MSVGRLLRITRFPVKSMAGEEREADRVGWTGLDGDRQYAFLKRDDRTPFPWFTGRDHSDLVRWTARYADPDAPRTAPVEVASPAGDRFAIDDPALLAELETAGRRPVTPMRLCRGAYDAMPVSIVTTASLAALDAGHGHVVDPRRFRANLLLESDRPDSEWIGRRLAIGEVELYLAEGAARCAMVTIDPDTGERDPSVLRTVAQRFGNRMATYASVLRPGTLRVGDAVELL